jgi:hypothetical protein
LSFALGNLALRWVAGLLRGRFFDATLEVFLGHGGHPDALLVSDAAGTRVFELRGPRSADGLLNAKGEAAYRFTPSRFGLTTGELVDFRTGQALSKPTLLYTRASEDASRVAEAALWLPAPTSALRSLTLPTAPEPRPPWLVAKAKAAAPLDTSSSETVFDLWDYHNKSATRRHSRSAAVDVAQALFFELPKSRSNEHEADLIGMKLLGLAGYDPAHAIGALRALHNEQPGNSGGQQLAGRADDTPRWFSTHPPADARIEKLQRELAEMDAQAQQGDSSSAGGRRNALRRVYVRP